MKLVIEISEKVVRHVKINYMDISENDYAMICDAVRTATPYEERPHGMWISKPKRIQVDETDDERIFETRQEWFCSSCGKSFGLRKPEDAFCKYCGSDNRKEGEAE